MIKKDLESLFKDTRSIFQIKDRSIFINKYFNDLTNHHYDNCKEYKKICDNLNYKVKNNLSVEDLPFLPVNVFKYLTLKSVDSENIVRIMQSSGTTGNNLSKIYLDESNAKNQIKALSQLFFDITQNKDRVPMLVIDSKSILKDRKNFSARSAAVLGFSLFAKNITYALKENMTLDLDSIRLFLKRNINTPKIVFGFTYLIWNNLFQKLSLNDRLDFNNSILIHGGGWKKLKEKNISNQIFKEELKKRFNFNNIINYYGMVEQTGSIFLNLNVVIFILVNFQKFSLEINILII